jgi:hypothetical protein
VIFIPTIFQTGISRHERVKIIPVIMKNIPAGFLPSHDVLDRSYQPFSVVLEEQVSYSGSIIKKLRNKPPVPNFGEQCALRSMMIANPCAIPVKPAGPLPINGTSNFSPGIVLLLNYT